MKLLAKEGDNMNEHQEFLKSQVPPSAGLHRHGQICPAHKNHKDP